LDHAYREEPAKPISGSSNSSPRSSAWSVCAMTLRWLRRAVAPITLAVASPGGDRKQAQDVADPEVLNRQVEQLYQVSMYFEATEIAKQALTLAERKFGPEHPVVAKALNNLATLYFVQGRDADAEPLFNSALVILKKALGPAHPAVAAAHNYLAELRIEQGEWARAATYLRSPETASSPAITAVSPPALVRRPAPPVANGISP
jgi:tetratricopeptide (TPR) repeat protein